MSYSNWTLESVVQTFQLQKIDTAGLFSEIEPITPSEYLATGLAKKAPLATAIGTEKARSEMIVADVLLELLEQLNRRISLLLLNLLIDRRVKEFLHDVRNLCYYGLRYETRHIG